MGGRDVQSVHDCGCNGKVFVLIIMLTGLISMDLKKINTALLSIVAILLIIACLVLIKILFTATKGFEWGSVSDWLSALANLTMAGAAVYAAYITTNWLKPNLQQQGLPKVVQFLQKDLSLLATEKLPTIHVELLIREIEWIPTNIIFLPSEKKLRLEKSLNDIKSNHFPKMPYISKIYNIKDLDSLLDELQWYGYHFKKEKYLLVKSVIEQREQTLSIIEHIISISKDLYNPTFTKEFITCPPKDYDDVKRKFETIINNLKPYSTKLNKAEEKLRSLRKDINLNSSIVTDFFDLKK